MIEIKIDDAFKDEKESIDKDFKARFRIDKDPINIDSFITENEFNREPIGFTYAILGLVINIKTKGSEAFGMIRVDGENHLISASWTEDGCCYLGDEEYDEYDLSI